MTARTTTGDRLVVEVRRWDDVDDDLIDRWWDLEGRAVEPNVYLAPGFVAPAVRHLTGADGVTVVTVSRSGEPDRLTGLGVTVAEPPCRARPVPHVAAYRSRHTYLSGLLVDGTDPVATIGGLLDGIRTRAGGRAGLRFTRLPARGPVGLAMARAVAERGWRWHPQRRTERAVLDLDAHRAHDRWDHALSANRRKKHRRALRGLDRSGPVTWAATAGTAVGPDQFDTFLRLEHDGWKGRQGSSLLADRADLAFFRAVCAAFRPRGRLLVTELTVGDRVAASTWNLTAGTDGFAFKLGWDPAFARHSPGVVNEVMMLEHHDRLPAGLRRIDSGAAAGSFIETYWPDRRALIDGVVTFDPATAAAWAVADRAVAAARTARDRGVNRWRTARSG
ncbi:MAG: GNAT family N-acetyltransferase [Acidimicrobiales bacterium]